MQRVAGHAKDGQAPRRGRQQRRIHLHGAAGDLRAARAALGEG